MILDFTANSEISLNQLESVSGSGSINDISINDILENYILY